MVKGLFLINFQEIGFEIVSNDQVRHTFMDIMWLLDYNMGFALEPFWASGHTYNQGIKDIFVDVSM